jgi:hypothetical protein
MEDFILSEPEQNYKTGYIKIFRSIKNHWLYEQNRKRTKLEAWLDLLIMASHNGKKEAIGYDLIPIERGQVLTSQERLCRDWKWDRNTVRRFLNSLHLDQMLTIKTTSKMTMITICNYDSYQSNLPSKRPTGEHQVDTISTTYNNVKELNKVINVDFDMFWDAYDKKVGLEKSKEKWRKLSDIERLLIMDYIPNYKISQPNKKFRKDPTTFINNKGWLDEIIIEIPFSHKITDEQNRINLETYGNEPSRKVKSVYGND